MSLVFDVVTPFIVSALTRRFKKEGRLSLLAGAQEGTTVLALTTTPFYGPLIPKDATASLLCIPDPKNANQCCIFFYSGTIEPDHLITTKAIEFTVVQESMIDVLYDFLANNKVPQELLPANIQ